MNDARQLEFLVRLGFPPGIIAHACHLPRRSVERMSSTLDVDRSWPVRPVHRCPGGSVKTTSQHMEMTLLSGAMYYLYGRDMYRRFSIETVVHAYDLYTTIRDPESKVRQLSPGTAYWVAADFVKQRARLLLCSTCKIGVYDADDMPIGNRCPYCRSVCHTDTGLRSRDNFPDRTKKECGIRRTHQARL